MTDGYVRVPASRLKALEEQERQLHELRYQLQQREAAKANAEFLQDQIVPSQETALETITSAFRTGQLQRQQQKAARALADVEQSDLNNVRRPSPQNTKTPPQTLDDLLPDAERDSADDILAAIESMPPEVAQTTLKRVAPLPLDQQLEQQREKHRTDAERNTTSEYMRTLQYGDIFATVLEMVTRDDGVVITTKLLTPQNVQTVMQAIETGMTRKSACALVGITYATFQRYQRLANEDEPQEPFASFMQLLEMAEARAEAVLVGRWQRHTADSWQASKALLEKRFRSEWGDRQQVELQLDQLMKMSPEQLLEIMGPEAKAQLIEMEQDAEGNFS